jgi:hypothetical protein
VTSVLLDLAIIAIPLGSILASFGLVSVWLGKPHPPRLPDPRTIGIGNSIWTGKARDLGEVDPRRCDLPEGGGR